MATTFKRETMADQILEHIDSGNRRVKIIKDTPSASPLSYSGDVPFWHTDLYKVEAPDRADPGGETLLLADLEQMRLKLSNRAAPMPYTRRHVDGDELFFIHRGSAKILTEVGEIDAPTGRFVFISRGVGYRVIPEADDFMALILESYVPLSQTELCATAELPIIRTTLPKKRAKSDGQEEWEERVVTQSWAATVIRTYDPIRTKQIIGEHEMVFGFDVDDIPASSPASVVPGLPFRLFESEVLTLDISKRTDPLPWYHRNNMRNEFEFVHLGNGDQDTDFGYLAAPPGTLYNLPRGVEHSPMNRQAPLVNLILETNGDVEVNPEILEK